MANYIDKDKLKRDLIDNKSFYPAIVKSAIENAPVITINEDYAIQCTCYALGCQQAEQIETKAKQEVAREIFDYLKGGLKDEIKTFKGSTVEFEQGACRAFERVLDEIEHIEKKYIGE